MILYTTYLASYGVYIVKARASTPKKHWNSLKNRIFNRKLTEFQISGEQ